MSQQQGERVLVKDDSDLFQLIKRLTDEQPPIESNGDELKPHD
jgi:hypothetical protein